MNLETVLPVLAQAALWSNLIAFFGGCLHGYLDYRKSIRSRRD